MNNNKTYSDLIYLMIDGEATDAESKILFSALKEYPELQSEFRSALKINLASKEVAFGNIVPLPLTNKLFQRAGLNYTGVPINNPTVANQQNIMPVTNPKSTNKFYQAMFGKYSMGLIGLFVGGLMSFLIFGNSNDSNDSLTHKNTSQMIDNKASTEQVIPIISAEINDDKAVQDNSVYSNNVSTSTQVAKSIDIVPNSINANQNSHSINKINMAEANKSGTNNNLQIFDTNQSSLNTHLMDNDIISDYEPIYDNGGIIENKSNTIKFGIEVKNSSFWNLPKETVFPSEISKFHNMELMLFYQIADELLLGMGMKQETFYVKYDTKSDLGQEYIYEQQPNLFNVELVARYSPFDFGITHPFIQLNFGGGKFGYTMRYAVGSSFNIYDNIGFVLSVENSFLRYEHQSNWNISRKIGINYGINYKF